MREHPDAEELLAEAADYFERRELEYERGRIASAQSQ